MKIEKKVIIEWPDLQNILKDAMEKKGFDIVKIEFKANRTSIVHNFKFEAIEIEVKNKKQEVINE